jgi:hypothetical protein
MMDLMGDLGGVMEVLYVLFFLLIGPIQKFSFVLKATKMLFSART